MSQGQLYQSVNGNIINP